MSSDEELQNQIESTGNASGKDALIYKEIFNALKREPDFKLPPSFADRVIARIEAARESKAEMVWLVVGVLSFVVTGIIAVALTNYKLDFGVMKFISGYPGLVAFGVVFILGLHWLDKKFIRKQMAE
jgi:hypothetical protein